MSAPHSTSVFTNYERIILVSLVIAAFLFGIIGYAAYFEKLKIHTSMLDLAYFSLNLFFMQFAAKGILPLTLEVARWLAPITLSYTLVRTVLALMQRQIQQFKIKHMTNHAVIMGVNARSANVALSFKQRGIDTVVIDEDEHNEYWGQLKKSGVRTLVANPSDATLLNAVSIHKALYLFTCLDSDTTNLEIIYDTYQLKKSFSNDYILDSVCQIHNHALLHALYNRPLFATNHQNLKTRIVNDNYVSARWLLNEFGPHRLVSGFSRLESFSIVIVGDNPFVPELIRRFAEIGVYGFSKQLNIILVGDNAATTRKKIIANYPAIAELISLKSTELARLNSAHFQSTINEVNPDIVYLCTAETGDKLLALQSLSDIAFSKPIVVSESDINGAFKWLKNEFKNTNNIHFAEVNRATCDHESIFENSLDHLAIAIHNNYIKQQLAKGDSIEQNPSLVDWDNLPEVLKDANRNQADHVAIKCQYLTDSPSPSVEALQKTLTKENMFELAKMEHNRWLAERKLSGWRFTSGLKDPVKKLSPSLIEWNDLSEDDKRKDIDTIEQLPELVQLLKNN